MDDLDPRRIELWGLHDFSVGRGLEIGPLHDPIVGRDRADVRYLDVADQTGLRAYYEDHPGVPIEDIPEIDYALTQPDGQILSLAEAARPGAPFSWAVASHVAEHVPDLVGWLADLAEVVSDDGSLVLVLPDRRYCFDVHRPPTSVGALLEAHHLGDRRPGLRAVYDHYSRAVKYDATALWHGEVPAYSERFHNPEEVQEKVAESLAGRYVDCHVWLFSPEGFTEQIHELRSIGACSWYVDRMQPTTENGIEFKVRLRRVPRQQDARGEILAELVTPPDRPEWVEPALLARGLQAQLDVMDRQRRDLEEQVAELESRVGRRRDRTARLRRRLARQQQLIETQRERISQLELVAVQPPARSLASRAARRLRTTVRRVARREGGRTP